MPPAGASRIANKWGHSGVILGSFGVIWGHFGSKTGPKNISILDRVTRPWSRPHGLGGPGEPWGTCWARCWSPWTDGAHAPASPSTNQQPGSIFSHGANSRPGGQLHHTQFGAQHVGQLTTVDPGGALWIPSGGNGSRTRQAGGKRGYISHIHDFMAAATEKINLVQWVKWAPKHCEHACLGSHRMGGPKAQLASLRVGGGGSGWAHQQRPQLTLGPAVQSLPGPGAEVRWANKEVAARQPRSPRRGTFTHHRPRPHMKGFARACVVRPRRRCEIE